MAKAVINLQKESGGITKISSADGTGVTELVLPESGNLVSVDTAVTDNAIARYDGTTGKLQNSGVSVDDSGNLLLTSGTGALGYGAGAGGTVTQLTSKSTNVTLNKPSGIIIMNNAALAAGTLIYFKVFNSLFSVNDTVIINFKGGGIDYAPYRLAVTSDGAAGYFYISVENRTASSKSEAVQIKYEIIKGATA